MTSQPRLAQQYGNMRLLRSEGGLQLWLADEAADGRLIFIQWMEGMAVPPALRIRLEHEVHQLDALHSPHLSRLLASQVTDTTIEIVLSVPTGPTLAERLRGGPLPPAETISIARHLVSALETLHGGGLRHRDLRPQHIVLCEPAAIIVSPLSPNDDGTADLTAPHVIEMLQFASPEQAGLLHQDVGPRSDLYAVGAILYACLNGSPPFTAPDARGLLGRLASSPPPPLPAGTPQALTAIVLRLLRKDSRDRYQSARSVANDLDYLADRLRAGETDPALPLSPDAARGTLTDPAFTGRDEEIARLLDRFADTAATGRPSLVLVEAISGAGKSRLLEEMSRRLRDRGALILTARGRKTESRAPFWMLGQLFEQLLDRAASDPMVAAVIEDHMVLHAELRALQRATRDAPTASETLVVHALRRLVERLSEQQPVVVVLDDCQWADSATVRLLHDAERGEVSASLCIVAAFRGDEPAAVALRDLPHDVHLRLPPLDAEDVWRMLSSMAGTLPAEMRAVASKAEGIPFIAVELLRGLVENQTLVHDGQAWQWTGGREIGWPDRSSGLLLQRLERLEANTLRILSACALLGRAFDLHAAGRVCTQPATVVVAALDEARRHFLLWTDASGVRYTFVHDRIRDSVIAHLPPTERRRLHRMAADACAAEAPDDCYTLAYHFAEAGALDLAFPHALAAARDARQRSALDVAEEHYRLAMRTSDTGAVIEGLAEVLLLRGRYHESGAYLRQALERTADPSRRAHLLGRLGELCVKSGRSAEGRQFLSEALALLGHPVPGTAAKLRLEIARNLVEQCLHSVLPARYVGRRPLDDGAADRLASVILEQLSYGAINDTQWGLVFWSHLTALNLVELYGPSKELGWAWIHHGNLLVQIPWLSRARRFIDRGLEVTAQIGDRVQYARGLSRRAYLEFSQGNLAAALTASTESVAHGARGSDHWEYLAGRMFHARILFLLGHTRLAVEMSRNTWHSLKAAREFTVGFGALGDWVRMTGGMADLAEMEGLGDIHDRFALCEQAYVRGFDRLCHGDAAEAARHFDRAIRISGGREPITHYPGRFCWLATAWRMAADGLPLGAGPLRARYLRAARAAARKALALSKRAPLHRPHALRESALLAAEAGRELTARRMFTEAIRVSVEQESAFDFAWCLYDRGRVGAGCGWADAAHNLADARWAFRTIGLDPTPLDQQRLPTLLTEARIPTPALMDRFLSAIEAGRSIVSCLSVESVLDAVRRAAIELLRPQTCSLQRANTRSHADAASVLSIPLMAGGSTVAIFTLTHEVALYFQEEERMLAAFIATLGGAALETAERFAAIESLSRSVAERSAQLQSSLDEKEIMLREVHHRVKNNLQLILSLINLQGSHNKSARFAAQLGNLSQRIRSMALIHDLIYGEENLAEISMQQYLRTLVRNLAVTYDATGRGISTDCELDSLTLPMARAVDCGLIVNELVSNALQHGFPHPRGGTVRVSLTEEDGTACICVADDGVGFDVDAEPSLGLTLVRLLAQKQGRLTMVSDGTTRISLLIDAR